MIVNSLNQTKENLESVLHHTLPDARLLEFSLPLCPEVSLFLVDTTTVERPYSEAELRIIHPKEICHSDKSRALETAIGPHKAGIYARPTFPFDSIQGLNAALGVPAVHSRINLQSLNHVNIPHYKT
jgi:hypothetical protein